MKNWCLDIGATVRTFDQCRLGHRACPKSTTIADKLGMVTLEGKFCTCWAVQKYKGGISSEELGRYGYELMRTLCDKIADPTPEALSMKTANPCHLVLKPNEWSDRKSKLAKLDDGILGKVQHVRMGFKWRPLRDGAGKVSPGLMAPSDRKINKLSITGECIVSYCIKWMRYVDLNKKGKQHPFPDWFLEDIVKILTGGHKVDTSIKKGQPFRLGLIKHLLITAGDPDFDYMDKLAEGLNLGVTEPIPRSPGIWPTVEELKGEDYNHDDTNDDSFLTAMENYSSAVEHLQEIEATYLEEKAPGMDMVLGPFSLKEAAEACGCREDQIIHGAMGANIEKDKIRPIYDATASGVNPLIQNNTFERTTAPGLADGAHAARWGHRNVGWQYKRLGALKQFIPTTSSSKHPKNGKNTTNTPVKHADTLTVLKSDVSKAHRRCMIKREDWRFQVAKLGENYWINKVGTYGVASAQIHWGRLSAAVVRLLYYLFPDVDWFMIFVDDLIALMNKYFETPLALAIMATLYAIGCPMAWHKTSLGHRSTWVGFEMHLEYPRFRVATEKLEKILAELTYWTEGKHQKALDIHKTVSRVQWGTAACPTVKPFLEPIWRWMSAVKRTGGVPSKSIRQIATLLMKMLSQFWHPDIEDSLSSDWHGASDASRRDDRSGIGGWISNIQHPDAIRDKSKVWWFMEEFDVENRDKWLFHGATPCERVAPMELFGTLALLEALWSKMQGPSTHRIYFKAGTDNQGNSISILNSNSKSWPSSIILMQLVWSAHNHNIDLGIAHVFRENNGWADQLAGGDATGFDPKKRLIPSMATKHWDLLSMFTTEEALKTAITRTRGNKKKNTKVRPT